MKKLSVLALCALLAATAAEAKTYYVDASRPNNNGNGLKLATAKKTIQSAINLAQNGDTILVYPGEYAPIKTYNKKISVKAVEGRTKTRIVLPNGKTDIAIALLGKTWTDSYVDTQGAKISCSSAPESKGQATSLTGFLLDGKNRGIGTAWIVGISGGTAKSCSVQRLGEKGSGGSWAALNAKLTGCTILDNNGRVASDSVLSRCQIKGNQAGLSYALVACRLFNCLVVGNRYYGLPFAGAPSLFYTSTIVNCTIAKNYTYRWESSDAAALSSGSKFYNCILRGNCRQTKTWEGQTGKALVHNVDSGNTYMYTNKDNKDPKFVDEAAGNYKLSKGSPFIDNGKVLDAIKSGIGTLDLAGQKRIRGKAIDRGCYEY